MVCVARVCAFDLYGELIEQLFKQFGLGDPTGNVPCSIVNEVVPSFAELEGADTP